MLHRPLVFVSGITVGDYLLWNWSLGGNHGVLALVSGLTLPLLAAACLWLLVLNAARLLISLSTRSQRIDSRRRTGTGERDRRRTGLGRARLGVQAARARRRRQAPAAAGRTLGEPSRSTTSASGSSGKLAA